jgi:hypothetical protein
VRVQEGVYLGEGGGERDDEESGAGVVTICMQVWGQERVMFLYAMGMCDMQGGAESRVDGGSQVGKARDCVLAYAGGKEAIPVHGEV